MAAITLYRDEECKDVFSSGFVGRYRTVYGSSPIINIEYATRTIGEEQIEFGQLYEFYASTLVPESDATKMWIEPTETKTLQSLYITPDNRIDFYCWGTGATRYFESVTFSIKNDLGDWVAVTATHGNTLESYVQDDKAFAISFRTCKTGSYNVYGTVVDIRQPNIFAYDLHYFTQQGQDATFRCFNGVCPFDKYYQDTPRDDYEPETGNKSKGGTGTGYYPNSVIPALPTNSINAALSAYLGTGNGLSYYKLQGNGLEVITAYLYDTNYTSLFRPSAMRDCLASVVLIPYDVTPDVTNGKNIIHLGHKPLTPNEQCDYITRPLREIDFGMINLTSEDIGFQNYADIIHTTATLYLPGFGNVNIDMSSLQGGILTLHGVIDVRNGNILYRLESQARLDDTPVLYGHYNSNIGIDVPVGGSNASISLPGAIASIGTIGVGVATGNPIAIAGGVGSLAQQSQPTVDKSGAMQPQCAGLATPVPILQISKKILLSPPGWGTVNGIMSAGNDGKESDTLSDFSGFLQCEWCDLSGISGATDGEKEEIERLLKEGVYV